MKISLSGAQCTGKSTLMKALREEFPDNYVFFDEVVRKLVKEEGIKINKDFDFDSQHSIMTKHIKNMDRINFVTDRGLLDSFVYAYYGHEEGKFSKNDFRIFEFLFTTFIREYDHIFYLPIEFELEDDGFRSIDNEFRNKIDKLFKELLEKYNVEHTILEGNVKERIKIIKSKIV